MSLMYSPYKSSVKSSGKILRFAGTHASPSIFERSRGGPDNGKVIFRYDGHKSIFDDTDLWENKNIAIRLTTIPYAIISTHTGYGTMTSRVCKDSEAHEYPDAPKLGTEYKTENTIRNDRYIYVPEIQESFSGILSTVLKMYNHPDWIKINCCPMLNFQELLILKISELDKKIEHIEAFLESRNVLYELD